MSFNLYVMVSIPEAKMENVFTGPTILGVFGSKEKAKTVWKQRSESFKDIKAKTVHVYYEMMQTERTELPEYAYVWATYTSWGSASDEKPELDFLPFSFFETYEDYQAELARVKQYNPISKRTFCEDVGFVFYASNENIIEKCKINHLVRIPVTLTDSNKIE